jgi:hypothetical protein
VLFDDNTVGISAISDAAKVHIRRVIGEDHVRAELLKAGLALVAVTVGVNQAADCGNIAGLELGDSGADFGDTPNDLMSRNAWIDSAHRAPLVTDYMEISVADTAEKDFNLYVVFAWITSKGSWWGQAAILHHQQHKPSLYTDHAPQS